jgi:RHS repeat-associated protein
LANASWSTTVATATTISKNDVKDLRDRLNDALTVLTIPPPTYTDATLNGAPNGTLIKGAHITELRLNVTKGVGAATCSKSITQFVQDFYQGTFGRQPTVSELSHWVAILTQAQMQGVTPLLNAAQSLGATLFNSVEYTGTTHSNEAYVTDLYEGYLHRAPDPSGFTNWVNTLLGGASRAAVRQGFADSVEFRENVTALCWTAVSTGGIRYVFSDLQGSARAIMNNVGSGSSTVIARHDFLPYGEEIWAGTGLRTSAQGFGAVDLNRFKYGSLVRDSVTELDHTKWRKYDSTAGRWTSPDPYRGSMAVSNPQSFNRYSYTQNDPVNRIDPTGLVTCFGYHVFIFHILDGQIIGVDYLGFLPVFCWEDGPEVTRDRRGPIEPPEPPRRGREPYVDQDILNECTQTLYGVTTKEFTESRKGKGGSFKGNGPLWENGGNNADFTVNNNSTAMNTAELTEFSNRRNRDRGMDPLPPGQVAIGNTPRFSPNQSYTASDLGPMEMIVTQVHELGHSLNDLVGLKYPGDTGGQKLEDCVKNKGGFKYR